MYPIMLLLHVGNCSKIGQYIMLRNKLWKIFKNVFFFIIRCLPASHRSPLPLIRSHRSPLPPLVARIALHLTRYVYKHHDSNFNYIDHESEVFFEMSNCRQIATILNSIRNQKIPDWKSEVILTLKCIGTKIWAPFFICIWRYPLLI